MKIDGFQQIQLINNSESISALLNRLNAGDVLRAQVLEISTNELLLKLFDGTVFSAATTVNIEAKPGECLDFLVSAKSDSQIFLETVKKDNDESSYPQKQIKEELIRSRLKPDVRNLQIASELKLNNLPINQEMVKNIISVLNRFKGMDIEKLVFLAANNLDLDENNIRMLDNLIEGRLNIGDRINDLLNTLAGIKDEEGGKEIMKDLSSFKPVTQQKTTDNVFSTLREFMDSEAKIIKDSSALNLLNNHEFQEKLTSFLKSNYKENIVAKKDINIFLQNEIEGFEILPDAGKNELEDLISRAFLKLKSDNNLLHKGIKSDDSLKEAYEKFYFQIDGEVSDPDMNVKELYKDIYSRLEAIKENINTSSAAAKNDIANSIDYIQNGIKFLNEINNYSAYVQIPLDFGDRKTTGELYILKRGHRKKKINPEDVTMLLSLDTQNMGRVDSLVSINKRNISLNLRVEDQKIIDFLKVNYRKLYQKLLDKGYKLFDIKYRITDSDINITNIEKKIKKELESRKSSVDLRI